MTFSKLLRTSSGIAVALSLAGAPAVAAEPELSSPPATALAKDDASGPSVTFAGFHVFANGSSRIWVKLTSAVTVDVHPAKGSVTFVLRGARVPSKNNKNPLLTSDFASPVMSARLVPTKSDAELVVTLREQVTPKHRIVKRPDGTVSVQVDFPAPSSTAPAAPTEPSAPAK